MKIFNERLLFEALELLENRLAKANSEKIELVVCGGSALITMKLVSRTTKDIDIVARIANNKLIDPDPLPEVLVKSAAAVTQNLDLPPDWLNTGPADLFKMGLPVGFQSRLEPKQIGELLTVYFISRLDQIHFKLYASVDRGGYHIEDLLALNPTDDELLNAANWCFTHDVSEGFAYLMKELLTQLGYKNVAAKL